MAWKSKKSKKSKGLSVTSTGDVLTVNYIDNGEKYRDAFKFLVGRDPVLSRAYQATPDFHYNFYTMVLDDGFRYRELLEDIRQYRIDEAADEKLLSDDKARQDRRERLFGAPEKGTKK